MIHKIEMRHVGGDDEKGDSTGAILADVWIHLGNQDIEQFHMD